MACHVDSDSNSHVSNSDTHSDEEDEWDEFIDKILPDTPDSTKFTKIEFTGRTFNVESFIAKRKDDKLEDLRGLLSHYRNKLKEATTILINEDYADFIYLSGNLIGVGPSIDRVVQPLTESRNDLFDLHSDLQALTEELERKLIRLKEIENKKKDIERMRSLDTLLNELESSLEGLKTLQTGESSAFNLGFEKLSKELVEAERITQSFKESCPLSRNLEQRLASLCHEAFLMKQLRVLDK